jgi:hypothetical protein
MSAKFTKKDYESNNGMQTSVWGPALWHVFHTVSFNYPVKPTPVDKKNYTNWLTSFQYTLPCVYCRNNLKNNLKKSNFSSKVMKNRDTFSRFIYKLHNCINTMLKKKIKISYEEVRVRYEHFRSRCDESTTKSDIKKQQKNGREKGCESAMHNTKSKCVINIVPKTSKKAGFHIAAECIKK